MKQDNKDKNKIETYLLGLMPSSEKNAFEEEMAKNESLAQAVAFQKLEHRTIELIVKQDLAKNLDEWKKEKQSKVITPAPSIVKMKSSRRKRIYQLMAAASVALLTGLFALFNWVENNYSHDVLATNSFTQTSILDRGGDNLSLPEILRPALGNMIAGDYQSAINQLETIEDPVYQETTKILLAESYFKIDDFSQTIQISKDIIQKGQDDTNIEKAEWYLYLSYLAANQNETDAQKLLSKMIDNPNHAFHPYAEKLKSEMNSFWSRWAN